MTSPPNGTDGTVFVDSNLFHILDPMTADMSIYDRPEFAETGLVDRCRDGLSFICATHLGDVEVSFENWSEKPSLDDTDDWEDIAEIGFTWHSHDMEAVGEVNGLELPVPGPGPYRLRVSARHRDEGEDRWDDMPLETFRLQLWPGDVAAPVLLKGTSRTGAHWRAAAERRGT